MKNKSVIVTKRGGPEVLQIVESELLPPAEGEAQVKILAAHVSLPDVQARYGHSPFKLKTPFTPGYAIVGNVESVGENVTAVQTGDLVGALTVYGGYTEYLNWPASQLIPIPSNINPAEAVTIILNYIVAYQTLHRSARVEPADKVLIIGASGGIGTAFLQLGKLAELKMYGLASPSKHHVLKEYGAWPIDYRSEDFVQVIRREEPAGLDAVFDGMGGDYIERGFSVLRRGGVLVGYGNPLSFSQMLIFLGQIALLTLMPNGRSAKYYGTGVSRFNRQPFLEDWATLFELLENGDIQPIIHQTFPILKAREANELLESGNVIGNIVLLAPALM